MSGGIDPRTETFGPIITAERFEIDWGRRQARCPQGKLSAG